MRRFMRRLWYAIRRHRLDADLAEEIAFHREMKRQEIEREGLEPREAAIAARRALGPVLLARDDARDMWIGPWLQSISQDVRFACRLLVRDRWFTVATIAVLALGIGMNNTVFAIVNAVLIRSLPFEHPERIVMLGTRNARDEPVRGPVGYRGLSFPEYEDWRDATSTFDGIATGTDGTMDLSGAGRPAEHFGGAYLSSNAFGLIGQQPIIGRDFNPQDDRPGAPAVVILGYRVWNNRYGRDPTMIGRIIRVNGTPSTVIGVMPPGFRFPLGADLWQPLALMPGLGAQGRDARALSAFGRLAAGVTPEESLADLTVIANRLGRDYPATNRDIQPTVMPYAEAHIAPQVELVFVALMGAVGFVLLIACANVANLLLARSAIRAREVGIRVSLGATRWRIVRQLLVESLVLASLAGMLGLALSVLGLRLFNIAIEQVEAVQPGKPYWLEFTMDGSVFAFLAAVCLGTAILFGLAPALHAARTNVNETLKDGGRSGSGGLRARRWTSLLVIGELALTLVLLSGAGFMMHRFIELYRADLGIDTSRLTTIRLILPLQTYGTPEQRGAFYQRLEQRLGAIQGIASVSITNNRPGGGGVVHEVVLDGRPPTAGDSLPRVSVVTVGLRYFETLGLRVVRGRSFRGSDGTIGQEAAIVNEPFVSTYLPHEGALGRRIRLVGERQPMTAARWLTIVGVSPTVSQDTDGPPQPIVYVPLRSEPTRSVVLLVRAKADLETVVPRIRQEVRALDPDLPLFHVQTLDEWLAFVRWPQRVFGTMFAIFAGAALLLSALGLYALTAYSVNERTQEIGVRMALGALPGQVRWLVVRRAIVQLAIGLTLGLPAAVAVGPMLPFAAREPLTAVSVVPVLMLVLVVVSLTASFWPARRATRLDPVEALRHE